MPRWAGLGPHIKCAAPRATIHGPCGEQRGNLGSRGAVWGNVGIIGETMRRGTLRLAVKNPLPLTREPPPTLHIRRAKGRSPGGFRLPRL